MFALRRSLTRPRARSLNLRFDFSTAHSLRRNNGGGPRSPFPTPSTAKHHDLPSFLSYAEQTGLDVTSTVYVGTHYEYTVASTLSQYGIQAIRVGGISDYGVDLLGTWTLPSQPRQLKVIMQCKGGSQRITPSLIRELEGSFVGAPVGWRGKGVIAFLVSEGTASKGVREGMGRSRWPMGFISCSRDGVFQQMVWNQRAEEEGLRGMNVAIRHSEDGNGEAKIVLTYQGKRVRDVPDEMVSGAA
ncbi:putative glutathione s-transferase [Colletotrichum plurivorum]|uniref:Putative glutathione s-transferase n=1 Tax=Colletotrichum plurivorum TaxID=2175906 RepID=A0A8H6U6I1_9PEZI|nr:putative glutathione s-transferase [Colletotrichum plurivorum]